MSKVVTLLACCSIMCKAHLYDGGIDSPKKEICFCYNEVSIEEKLPQPITVKKLKKDVEE